eukprot:538317-Karenia_brevis.AAC.1
MTEPLGRQPEPNTQVRTFREGSQSPAQINDKTFGQATRAQHTSKNLWEGSQSPAQTNDRTFGEAARAPH